MLRKPYLKVAEEGNNNYYILYIDDTFFIATESVVRYNKSKELSQGLKLMPLYAPVMMLFMEMLNVEKIDEKTIEGLGTEEFFEKINVKKVREKIAKLTSTVTEESIFDYTTEIKSFSLRRFIDENEYEVLAIESNSAYRKKVWLGKSDKFGTLMVSTASLLGSETQKFTLLDTFIFNKDIISNILTEVRKIELKNKKKEIKELKKFRKRQEKIEKKMKKEKENE